MITFEDGVNGVIDVYFNFKSTVYGYRVGAICFEDKYCFRPDKGSPFNMDMIQAISKKLEELNGGEL